MRLAVRTMFLRQTFLLHCKLTVPSQTYRSEPDEEHDDDDVMKKSKLTLMVQYYMQWRVASRRVRLRLIARACSFIRRLVSLVVSIVSRRLRSSLYFSQQQHPFGLDDERMSIAAGACQHLHGDYGNRWMFKRFRSS